VIALGVQVTVIEGTGAVTVTLADPEKFV